MSLSVCPSIHQAIINQYFKINFREIQILDSTPHFVNPNSHLWHGSIAIHWRESLLLLVLVVYRCVIWLLLLSSLSKVWPVMVKPRGLGSSKPFTGENRLCLSASTLVLVRLGSSNDLPSVTIPLLSVRRFGHLDGFFFLELGRSAPHGPGEIWMEAREEGNWAPH